MSALACRRFRCLYALGLAAISGALCITLSACSGDPLQLQTRSVARGFMLHRLPDGRHYELRASAAVPPAGGGAVLGRSLQTIGWNSDYLIVRREALGADGEPWIIVDIRHHAIDGPFSDQDMLQMIETRKVQFVSPERAWTQLHWRWSR